MPQNEFFWGKVTFSKLFLFTFCAIENFVSNKFFNYGPHRIQSICLPDDGLFWKKWLFLSTYFCLSLIKPLHVTKIDPIWVQIPICLKNEFFLVNNVTFVYILYLIMLQHFKNMLEKITCLAQKVFFGKLVNVKFSCSMYLIMLHHFKQTVRADHETEAA